MSISIQKYIIRIERDETSNSKSPMWRCVCSDGDRVNVFKHTDASKNTFALFDAAGYGALLVGMDMKAIAHWKTTPITVTLVKPNAEAKFWDVAAVAPIVDGSGPDPAFTPSLPLYRRAVQLWAMMITDPSLPVVVLDTETTGLTDDDEIIDIAVCDLWGGTLINRVVRPSPVGEQRMLLADANGITVAQLTGISPERVRYADSFDALYDDIAMAINGKIVVVYNAPFDMRMLERQCARSNRAPFAPYAVVCAMDQFARWNGNWNAQREQFVPVKLGDACAQLEIELKPHKAYADVQGTIELIHKLAEMGEDDE